MSCESISLHWGPKRWWGNNESPVVYLPYIPFHTLFFPLVLLFFPLSLFFLEFFYTLSICTQRERKRKCNFSTLEFTERSKNMISVDISAWTRARMLPHSLWPSFSPPSPPNVSSIARKSWDLRVQEPRTEEEVGVYITFARFGRQAWIYIRLIRCIIMVYRICDASMWPRVILSFPFCIQYLSISHPSSLPSFLLWKNLRRRRFLFNETR